MRDKRLSLQKLRVYNGTNFKSAVTENPLFLEVPMKNKRLVTVFVCVVLAGWTSVAVAQQQLVTTLHINPGKVAEFEQTSKARHARMAAAGVTFLERVAVADGPRYRFVAPMDNMAALDTQSAQMDAVAPADSEAQANAREAIVSIDTAIRRARPELGHQPDNPRVPLDEAGFIRENRLYLRFGAEGDAVGILEQISALAKRRNLRDVVLVFSHVTGNDGPFISVQFFAGDAADFHAMRERNNETLGTEYQALVAQLGPLTRHLETIDWVVRGDLAYQPAQ